jgi:hypothetical protein
MADTKTSVDTAVANAVTETLTGKKFWLSKTFWFNVIAAAALLIQGKTGFFIGPEYQALLLTLINVGLRKITRDPIVW